MSLHRVLSLKQKEAFARWIKKKTFKYLFILIYGARKFASRKLARTSAGARKLAKKVQYLENELFDLKMLQYKNRPTLLNLIKNVLNDPFELAAFAFVASFCIGKLTGKLSERNDRS